MKKIGLYSILSLLILLSSCAQSEALEACIEGSSSDGFFAGILHGFIAPITFLISLISDNVAMYAVNNTGNWYDCGFLIGIGGFSSGILKSRKKKRS